MNPSSRLSDFSRGRYALLVVILGIICTIGPFATDLYLPALPTVADALGATTQAVALTVSTFLVGLAFGQLLAGPLSDAYGRKLPLLVGLVVFALSSFVSAFAPSAGVLAGVRLVQGVAGAAGVAIANAVVTDYARGRQAARLLSRLALVSGLAPIVAPLVGAQLLRLMPWRGLFVVLGGIGVAMVLSVAFGLAESHPRERRAEGGVRPALRAMGLLTRDGLFMGYTVSSSLTQMGFFAYLAGSSFIYHEIYGVTPTTFSLLFAMNALGMLAASQLNHRLLARRSPRWLLGASLAAGAVAGVAVLVVLAAGSSSVWALAVPLFVVVASLGMVYPNSTALALSLHPRVAGTASAYFGTMRLGVGALASMLVGVGGSVSGLPLGLVIAVSGIAALAVYAVVARRGHPEDTEILLDTPEEARVDMPVA